MEKIYFLIFVHRKPHRPFIFKNLSVYKNSNVKKLVSPTKMVKLQAKQVKYIMKTKVPQNVYFMPLTLHFCIHISYKMNTTIYLNGFYMLMFCNFIFLHDISLVLVRLVFAEFTL